MMAAFLPEALFPTEKNCRKLLRKLSGPNFSKFEENDVLMKHWFYLLKYFNNKSMMQHKIEIHSDLELSQLREKGVFLIGEYDRLTNYPHRKCTFRKKTLLLQKGTQLNVCYSRGH